LVLEAAILRFRRDVGVAGVDREPGREGGRFATGMSAEREWTGQLSAKRRRKRKKRTVAPQSSSRRHGRSLQLA
jgi:hypothetical protein